MNEHPEEGVQLLWTGGWDSTFQLLRLLLRDEVSVTPWYVIDAERRSTGRELDTMRRIRAELGRRFPAARQRLRPQHYRAVEDIQPDPGVTADWECVAHRYGIGGQYDWLARLCRQEGVESLQLSIHREDRAHGVVVAAREGEDEVSRAARRLFAPFTFPLLETTKLEMAAEAERAGWQGLMEMTWFCHSPTFGGRPCGRCNPCRYAAEEGLGRRIPWWNRGLAVPERYLLRPLRRVAAAGLRRSRRAPAR